MSKNYLLSCVGFYAALFILLTNHDVFAVADGEATFDYPQVGALLKFDSNRLDQVCSGTLIGTKTFLTAAHCVCNMMNPGVVGSCDSTEKQEGCIECNPTTQDFRVFFQGIGIKKVERINIAPEYNKNSIGNIGPDSDYATLILESDIKGVIPAELAKKEYYNTNQNIYIAGFGAITEKTTDVSYGIKRYGNNSISTCSEEENLYYEEAICYKKYKKSCACGRDSGGPVFLQSETDNNIYIIGITHGPVKSGDSYHCNDPRSIELASSAYYYKEKINRGSIDYNDDFYLVPVRQYSGPFEDYEKNDFHLPSGVKRLSFTINGTDNNIEDKNNYNLSLFS